MKKVFLLLSATMFLASCSQKECYCEFSLENGGGTSTFSYYGSESCEEHFKKDGKIDTENILEIECEEKNI